MKQQLLSLFLFFCTANIFAQAPVNDSLKNATVVLIEKNKPCQNIVGKTLLATPTPDSKNNYNDVWYYFIAENDIVELRINNIFFPQKNNDSHIFLSIQNNVDSTALANTPLDIYKSPTFFKGLTVGKKYYLRIATLPAIEQSVFFDLCLSYSSNESPNTTCFDAQLIPTSPTLTPIVKTNGLTPLPSLQNTGSVWYKFKANSTQEIINIELYKNAGNYAGGLEIRIFEGEKCTKLNNVGQVYRSKTTVRFLTKKDSFYYVELNFYQNLIERLAFNISVTTPPVVPNDDCATPIPLIPTTNISFTPKTRMTLAWATSDKKEIVDVVYVFEATKSFHFLFFENNDINSFGLENVTVSIFEDGKNCMTDTPFLSKSIVYWQNRYEIPNLSIGKKYLILISKKIPSDDFALLKTSFNISIGEQPIILPNDDCKNAIEIPIQQEKDSVTQTIVNTKWATASFNSNQFNQLNCGNSIENPNDVWYKFTANASAVKLSLKGSAARVYLVKGKDANCTSFEYLKCIPYNSETILDKLKSNQSYFIYIANVQDSLHFFLTALPVSPKNDSIYQAIMLPVNPSTNCIGAKIGTLLGATFTADTIAKCWNNIQQDVWYKFKATQEYHQVELEILTQTENKKMQFDVFRQENGKILAYDCLSNSDLKHNLFTEKDSIYFIRVSNNDNNTPFFKENTFRICLTSPNQYTPPINDKVCAAIALEMNETGLPFKPKRYTTKGASPSNLPKITCNNFPNYDFSNRRFPDVWFKFKAPDSTATLVLSDVLNEINTTFDTDLNVFLYKNECDSVLLENCEIASSYPINGLVKGKTYYIRTIGLLREPLRYFTFGLHLDTLPKFYPKNDFCKNAIALPMNIGYKTKFYEKCRLYNATCDSIAPIIFGNKCDDAYPYNVDVWYKFVATQTYHLLRHNNIPNPNNTSLIKEVFRGNCDQLVLESCSSDDFGSGQILVDDLTVGATYYVRLHLENWSNNTKFPYESPVAVYAPSVLKSNTCATSVQIKASDFSKKDTIYTEINKGERWYSFKPKQTFVVWQVLNLHNHSGSVDFQLYDDCKKSGLLPPTPFYSPQKQLLTLDTSKTYYIEFVANSFIGFDFQLYYLPEIQKNDFCEDAKKIPVNPTLIATSTIKDTMDNRLGFNDLGKKWYEFTPTQTVHHLIIKNFKPQLDTFPFGVNNFSNDSCQFKPINHSPYAINDTVIVFEGFEIGKKIKFQLVHNYNYVRFYDTYDIAFLSPPLHPQDECGIAKELDVSTKKTFSIDHKWASRDSILKESCSNDFYASKTIWYKFKPQKIAYKIRFSDFKTKFNANELNATSFAIFKGDCKNTTTFICKTILNIDSTTNAEYALSFIDTSTYYYLQLIANKNIVYQMTLEQTPPVVNDFCENAKMIEGNTLSNIIYKYSDDLKNANVEKKNDFCSDGERDVWYKFTAKSNRIALFFKRKKATIYGDVQAVLYKGLCDSLVVLQCSPAKNDSIILFSELKPNQVYFLKIIDKWIPENNAFDFHIVNLPDEMNESCEKATELVVSNTLQPDNYIKGTDTWSLSDFNNECKQYGFVWYKFTATANQHRIWFKSKYYDSTNVQLHKIAIFQTNCTDIPTTIRCITNPADTSNSSLQIGGLQIGDLYYVAVSRDFTFGTKRDEVFEIAIAPSTINFAAYTCQKALFIPVNPTIVADKKLSINTAGAPITADAFYTSAEIWFKFFAKSKRHKLVIDNFKTDSLFDIYYEPLTLNSCLENSGIPEYNEQDSTFENLKIGKVYSVYFKIVKFPKISNTQNIQNNVNTTFDIAIVTYPNRPVNDLCENATFLAIGSEGLCSTTTRGTTLAALPDNNIGNCTSNPRSIWYKFTAKNGYHVIDIQPLNASDEFIYELFLEDSDCNSLVHVTCSDREVYARRTYTLIEGKTYKIKVFNKNPYVEASDFDICVKTMPANDELLGASEIITDSNGKCIVPLLITSDLASITLSPIIPLQSCGFAAPTPDIWFKTIVKNKELSFNFTKKPQGATPVLAVYRKTGPVVFIADICQNDTLKNLNVGETLYFRLWSPENIIGAYEVCVNESNIIGIAENNETPFFSISPNPVSDNLSIVANIFLEEKYQLFIFNSLGEKVLSTTFLEKNQTRNISTTTLPNGIYFIELRQNNKKCVQKFVKN